MNEAVLRKELQGYIAAMPKQRLSALKPLLQELAQPVFTIEPASPGEKRRAEKILKEDGGKPEKWVTLAECKKRLMSKK